MLVLHFVSPGANKAFFRLQYQVPCSTLVFLTFTTFDVAVERDETPSAKPAYFLGTLKNVYSS